MNATAESRNEPEATLEVGQLLDGKYRVDYPVGRGGMAAVWAGTSERTGRRVALKVLLPSLTAIPGVDALFQREGLAASRVDHPNVVTVFDVIDHQGMACIVMELLDGEPLDSYLARNGPLSVSDACGLLLPAMSGVAAAHAKGVIHRDLKPQNIFVCIGPDGRAVTTKVLDFGISMLVERAREPVAAPMLMGTPAYMAPEQITGGAHIDERTDVYGFGVLFYEVLAGRVPFPGDPGPALYASITWNPPPPLGQFRPDLTAGLVRIIETALAKDPCHRHASLGDMVTALESELLGSTLSHRVLTPAAGAPNLVAHHAPTEVTKVDLALPREPTGEHRATKFLVNFPLAAETAHGKREAPAVRTQPDPWRGPWRYWHSHRRLAWTAIGVALFIAGGLTWRRLDGRPPQANLTPLPAESLKPWAPTGVVVEPLSAPATPDTDARQMQNVSDQVPVQPRMAVREAMRPARAPVRPSAKPKTVSDANPRAGGLSTKDF